MFDFHFFGTYKNEKSVVNFHFFCTQNGNETNPEVKKNS